MLKDRVVSGEESGGCAGCRMRITDRFYLLAVDRQWHLGCLQCSECKIPLDTEVTCFSRHGNIYCKHDYYRLFGVKRCSRCQAGISSSELVMRARDEVYHLHCFSCASCGILLTKGDHFGMRDGLVYCRPHYELLRTRDYCGPVQLEEASPGGGSAGGGTPGPVEAWTPAPALKGRPRKRKLMSPEPASQEIAVNMRIHQGALDMMHAAGELSSSMESLAYEGSTSPGCPPGGHLQPTSQQLHQQQRTKRMRTSFKHHQLRTMKSYFNINQNPDAKDLKQLAQKTGLSKRVLQVWFQNARAKWRRNLMRQEGGGGGGNTGPGGGVPPSMVSGSVVDTTTGLDDIRHQQTLNFADIY